MIERLLGFSDWFAADAWPDATCPICGIGVLRAEPAVEIETTASHDARDHDAWEPEWVRGFFSCVLRCQRASCREVTLATGEWRVRETTTRYSEYQEFGSFYRLQGTVPAVPILSTTETYPVAVRQALTKASQVIWVDPGAAGSRLRIAIERALDAKKIPQGPDRTKRNRYNTHQRINLLRAKNQEAAELLEAVKWVGNQGAHEGSLSLKGVLETAEILEVGLALLFDNRSSEIKRRARNIVKAKRLPRER